MSHQKLRGSLLGRIAAWLSLACALVLGALWTRSMYVPDILDAYRGGELGDHFVCAHWRLVSNGGVIAIERTWSRRGRTPYGDFMDFPEIVKANTFEKPAAVRGEPDRKTRFSRLFGGEPPAGADALRNVRKVNYAGNYAWQVLEDVSETADWWLFGAGWGEDSSDDPDADRDGSAGSWLIVAHAIWFPHWFLVLLLLLAPGRQLKELLVRNRRLRRGACPVCGYDLRGTPSGCPECGHGRSDARTP